MMDNCPLCNLNGEKDRIFYEDQYFRIVRTKKLKGHKERLMIVFNEHRSEISPDMEEQAFALLEVVGKKVFSYSHKFVIMRKTFGTILDHWHKVASDLNPNSEDFEQILATPWIKVIEVKTQE